MSTLQFGHDWPGLAVVPDSPALTAVLAAIDGFRDLDGVLLSAAAGVSVDVDECRAILAMLLESGAVVDRPTTEQLGIEQATAASWWLLAGPESGGDTVARDRRACRVWVEGAGAEDRDSTIAARCRELVRSSGMVSAESATAADVVIVAADGIPDRASSDEMMHLDLPHVWVHLRDLVVVIGPFVLPARSACLRCTDSARTELDPTWPAVVSSALARPRSIDPCDPVVATLAAAWAVQEVAVWASGIVPSTYDAIMDVPVGLGPVSTHSYAIHPQCGCGWQTWQDTMGA